MRPRSLIDVSEDTIPGKRMLRDTYERVRRTLDEAIAELEQILPSAESDRSRPHRI